MSIHDSHDFVLEKAKANVAFILDDPKNVGQAKQINAALATIVASERNMIMSRALDRALKNDENLPRLPEC